MIPMSLQEIERLHSFEESLHSKLDLLNDSECAALLDQLRSAKEAMMESDPIATHLELKKLAVEGNPWPYIEWQWGQVITGEEYAADRLYWAGRRHLILDSFQRDTIQAIFTPRMREVWVKGATGTGKGAACGIGLCAYYDCFPCAIIIMRDSLKNGITVCLGEILQWWNRARIKPQGKILTEKVEHHKRHYIQVLNPKSDEGFSGVHPEYVVFWMDESTIVTTAKWNMADTQATLTIGTFNPRTNIGRSAQAFPIGPLRDKTRSFRNARGWCTTITADGHECCNVRNKCLEKPTAPTGGVTVNGKWFAEGEDIPPEDYAYCRPIIPAQTCYDKLIAIKANPDPNYVDCMAYGRFPAEDPQTQLFRSVFFTDEQGTGAVDLHNRWRRLWDVAHGRESFVRSTWWKKKVRRWAIDYLNLILPVTSFGFDVQRSTDGDEATVAAGGLGGCRKIHVAEKLKNLVLLADWFESFTLADYSIEASTGYPVAVDVVGVGGGLADILKSRGWRVLEVVGSASSSMPQQWLNLRTELFATLAQRLDQTAQHGRPWLLPEDQNLLEELPLHRKLYYAGDAFKFRVTPKDRAPDTQEGEKAVGTIRDALGRSPDRADCVSYLWHAVRSCPQYSLADWLQAIRDVQRGRG